MAAGVSYDLVRHAGLEADLALFFQAVTAVEAVAAVAEAAEATARRTTGTADAAMIAGKRARWRHSPILFPRACLSTRLVARPVSCRTCCLGLAGPVLESLMRSCSGDVAGSNMFVALVSLPTRLVIADFSLRRVGVAVHCIILPDLAPLVPDPAPFKLIRRPACAEEPVHPLVCAASHTILNAVWILVSHGVRLSQVDRPPAAQTGTCARASATSTLQALTQR